MGGGPANRLELLAALTDAVDDTAAVELIVRNSTLSIAQLSARDWSALEDRLRTADGLYPGDFAWRCGYSYHHLGMYQNALHVYEHASTSRLNEIESGHLYACHAGTAWKLGDVGTCKKYAAQALELAERSADDGALAAAWLSQALLKAIEGDRHENARAYMLSLEYAEASGDLITQTRVHNNVASSHLEEARYDKAVEHLQLGLALNESTGHLAMQGLLRTNVAEALLGAGRLDEALVEAETARAILLSVHSPMVSIAWQLIGTVQCLRGDLAQAELAFEESARLAEEAGETQSLIPSLAGLAICRFAENPSAAQRLIEEALELPAAMGHVPVYVAGGWVHLCAGNSARALEFGERAKREAGRRRDLVRLAESLELCVLASKGDSTDQRLLEAASIWRSIGATVRLGINDLIVARLSDSILMEDLARQRLRGLGVRDHAQGLAGPLHAIRPRERVADIRVQALGTFTVYRDGEPIAPNDLTSGKVRDLIKIIATHDGPAISRDALRDLLWPGERNTAGRLSVSLSRLRSALDPERRRENGHYVVANGTSVALSEESVSIDVRDFRRIAREALVAASLGNENAVKMLEMAAARHTGPLFNGDTADDWAIQIADELNRLGRDVIRALAFALIASPDPDSALPWLARLLIADPYDEPTYQAIVRLLIAGRRHGEARRYFRAYALRMQEIDAAPASWDEFLASATAF